MDQIKKPSPALGLKPVVFSFVAVVVAVVAVATEVIVVVVAGTVVVDVFVAIVIAVVDAALVDAAVVVAVISAAVAMDVIYLFFFSGIPIANQKILDMLIICSLDLTKHN